MNTKLTFGDAIEALKAGHQVAREGWNDKNMFIFLHHGRTITGVDPTSPIGGDFLSRSHICMRDAQGGYVVGWLASQTDMLSEDWVVVGPKDPQTDKNGEKFTDFPVEEAPTNLMTPPTKTWKAEETVKKEKTRMGNMPNYRSTGQRVDDNKSMGTFS